LAMLAFLRFDVAAVVHDLLDTIHARSGAISHFGIADVFEMSTIVFIAVALAVCFLGVSSGRNRIWLFAAALYTVAAEALFVRTNAFQGTTYPLYIVFTFILLANLGKNLRARQYSSASFTASLVVIGLSLMVPNFYTHLRSLALLMRYKTNAELRAGAYRVEGDHMRDLAFYNHQENEPMRQENGQFYTGSLNDGIDLLKKYSTSSDMVTTIGFHNPFSYALLRKPPRAGSTWLLMDNNVSAGHMLSNERMFGDATLVMVPKYVANTHFQNDQILFREYAPYLLSHFTFVAESDRWRLYRRLPGR